MSDIIKEVHMYGFQSRKKEQLERKYSSLTSVRRFIVVPKRFLSYPLPSSMVIHYSLTRSIKPSAKTDDYSRKRESEL